MTCHPTPTNPKTAPRSSNHELCISSYTIHQEYSYIHGGHQAPHTTPSLYHHPSSPRSGSLITKHDLLGAPDTFFGGPTIDLVPMLEIEHIANLIACAQDDIDVVFRVCCRQAETDSGRDQGCCAAYGLCLDGTTARGGRGEEGTHGYATTTTTIGVLSFPNLSNIIRENMGIFAGLYSSIGTIGESRCP